MLTAFVLAAILQTAPELVGASPKDGDVAVPAGDQVLSFTFDQPMRRDRWSVTGGDLGAKPQFTGVPSFSPDGRTFSIGMRLEPGRTYVVGANGPSHTFFQSEAGEPAKPVLIHFTTSPER